MCDHNDLIMIMQTTQGCSKQQQVDSNTSYICCACHHQRMLPMPTLLAPSEASTC